MDKALHLSHADNASILTTIFEFQVRHPLHATNITGKMGAKLNTTTFLGD
jgi:hypothetical protein